MKNGSALLFLIKGKLGTVPEVSFINIMRKLLLCVVSLFGIGISVSYAQIADEAEYQAYLERSKEQMVKKQKLVEAQHGRKIGATYSVTGLAGTNGGSKNGVLFFYGNRVSESWMLCGLAGVDILSPNTLLYLNNKTGKDETIDRPSVYFPVMGEARLYFGTSHFMPYLFTDLGVAFSDYSGVVFNTGIGADLNFKDSHTIFLSFGLGTSPATKVPDTMGLGITEDQSLKKKGFFSINFKLGYYF